MQRVSAKGEFTRKDLGHSLDTSHPNGELQCQVATVVRVGHRYTRNIDQDVFGQLDVEGRPCFECSESQRCSSQFLVHAADG